MIPTRMLFLLVSCCSLSPGSFPVAAVSCPGKHKLASASGQQKKEIPRRDAPGDLGDHSLIRLLAHAGIDTAHAAAAVAAEADHGPATTEHAAAQDAIDQANSRVNDAASNAANPGNQAAHGLQNGTQIQAAAARGAGICRTLAAIIHITRGGRIGTPVIGRSRRSRTNHRNQNNQNNQ